MFGACASHTVICVEHTFVCDNGHALAHGHLHQMQRVCVWRRAPSTLSACVSYIEKRCGMYLWYVERYHTLHKTYVRKMWIISRATDPQLTLNRGCIFSNRCCDALRHTFCVFNTCFCVAVPTHLPHIWLHNSACPHVILCTTTTTRMCVLIANL